MEYKLDLNRIKPKNINKSDKYSKQIYQYIKKHPEKTRIFYIQTHERYENGQLTYEDIPFDINNFKNSHIWIGSMNREKCQDGYIDWMYGNSLMTIVSPNKEKYTVFANLLNNNETVVDITEQFWEKYIEIGRCIYDHHYWLLDDEERYTYSDSTHRRCNWCGKEQLEEAVPVSVIVSYNKKKCVDK